MQDTTQSYSLSQRCYWHRRGVLSLCGSIRLTGRIRNERKGETLMRVQRLGHLEEEAMPVQTMELSMTLMFSISSEQMTSKRPSWLAMTYLQENMHNLQDSKCQRFLNKSMQQTWSHQPILQQLYLGRQPKNPPLKYPAKQMLVKQSLSPQIR